MVREPFPKTTSPEPLLPIFSDGHSSTEVRSFFHHHPRQAVTTLHAPPCARDDHKTTERLCQR
ncbi:hypothetical protein BFJ70_g2380 [Fusarium oxysporum]|nr:hypothetical protein BFJ70_g2380 [Fusarium oxysporum]